MSLRATQEESKSDAAQKALRMLEAKHTVEAVGVLKQAAKARDSEAMWMLGVCFEYGVGVEQDISRAEQLYQMSEKQQNQSAALLLGKLKNHNGRGNTLVELSCAVKKYKTCRHCGIVQVTNLHRQQDRRKWSKRAVIDAQDASATQGALPRRYDTTKESAQQRQRADQMGGG